MNTENNKSMVLRNGLEVINDIEQVDRVFNEVIELIENRKENLLVGSGEHFNLDFRLKCYFENKVLERSIENQSPTIMSTGFWTKK